MLKCRLTSDSCKHTLVQNRIPEKVWANYSLIQLTMNIQSNKAAVPREGFLSCIGNEKITQLERLSSIWQSDMVQQDMPKKELSEV